MIYSRPLLPCHCPMLEAAQLPDLSNSNLTPEYSQSSLSKLGITCSSSLLNRFLFFWLSRASIDSSEGLMVHHVCAATDPFSFICLVPLAFLLISRSLLQLQRHTGHS